MGNKKDALEVNRNDRPRIVLFMIRTLMEYDAIVQPNCPLI